MKELTGMRLRKPCDNCPFRTDVGRYLRLDRYADIAKSIVDRGENFTCHKHNHFDDHAGAAITHSGSMSCAGAMIFLQHLNRPNACMQIMQRLGMFDPNKLRMNSPVYYTRIEFEQGINP